MPLTDDNKQDGILYMIRFPPEIAGKLEELAIDSINAGGNATQHDLIRALVIAGIDTLEDSENSPHH
jgi:hypothetical protein